MTIRNPNCNLCGLGAGANHPCLVGKGNTKAKLMIVGQNPGYNEDQGGKPFIGRAGEYLDNSLAEYGIQRSECFVTNTVKCYTEGNRPPTKVEVKACVPYLWREIKALKPQYIMLLGNVALSAIGMSGIMKYRGRVIEKEGFSFYPAIHPAAVLRNPRNDTIFKQDVAFLANLLKGVDTTPKYDIRHVTDYPSFKQMLIEVNASKMVAYDIESEGLDERQGKIWLIGVTVSPKMAWVLPVCHPESPFTEGLGFNLLKVLIKVINSKPRWRVAQNGKFDNKWMKHHTGLSPRTNWDTMLASHLLNENTPNDLEYLSQTILGMPPYKGKITFTGEGLSSLKDMGDYCGEDCCNTYRIAQKQIPQVRDDQRLWNLYTRLIVPLSKTLENVEQVGIYMDVERLTERKQVCEEKIQEFEAEMSSLTPQTCDPPTKTYKTKPPKVLPWNFNSYQQVGKVLFSEEGFDLTPYSLTPTGEPCTDDESLTFIKEDAPEEAVKFLETLSSYRTWRNKYLGTYIEPWTTRLQQHRVHTSFKVHGTVTGRLSGDFQQVPREKFIKSIISTPPGWKLVECDQSQIELRIAAFISGDARMLRAYQQGEDLHRLTASIVTHKAMSEITGDERFKSKAINFGLIYGMSTNGFRIYAKTDYGIDLTIEEAELFRRRFFEAYKGLIPWHKRQKDIAHKLGYVRYPDGRIRRLPDIYSTERGVQGEAERQAINSVVQGFASDITLLSVVRLHRILDPSEAHIFLTVHDSVMFYIREDCVDKWIPVIKATMEDRQAVKDTFDVGLTIPLVVDVKVGTHWGELKEISFKN